MCESHTNNLHDKMMNYPLEQAVIVAGISCSIHTYASPQLRYSLSLVSAVTVFSEEMTHIELVSLVALIIRCCS